MWGLKFGSCTAVAVRFYSLLVCISNLAAGDTEIDSGGGLQWGPAGVHVKDIFYPIVRLHWTDRRGPQTAELSGANMGGQDVAESMGGG